ncbi:MAG: 3-deoxy-D-manno-octulosonic acid transferase [Candidatus Eiseniibacteriota bacterium]
MMSLALYRAVWAAGLALRVPELLLGSRRAELDERLGRGDAVQPGALWIHAASVGEVTAAEVLVRALRRARIGPIAVTTVTRTGRARAAELRPDLGPWHAPLDAPVPVARFLDRVRPRALVILETELWPNLLLELGRRSIPWGVASARLSPRAEGRYRPARGLLRAMLAGVRAVAARSEADAERFVRLGAPAAAVRAIGDLKDDREVPPWAAPPEDRPRWAAACTRPGEEKEILEALQVMRGKVPSGELVLAPRHPERFDEVARLVERAGLPLRRWSARDEPASGDGWSVLLVDEMGVLPDAYRRSWCAFVGGTLRPFGGHNPLEAAAGGRSVLVGPHTESCELAVGRLEARGGLIRVQAARELGERVAELLADPAAALRSGRAAWDAAKSFGGAADATVAFLAERGALG